MKEVLPEVSSDQPVSAPHAPVLAAHTSTASGFLNKVRAELSRVPLAVPVAFTLLAGSGVAPAIAADGGAQSAPSTDLQAAGPSFDQNRFNQLMINSAGWDFLSSDKLNSKSNKMFLARQLMEQGYATHAQVLVAIKYRKVGDKNLRRVVININGMEAESVEMPGNTGTNQSLFEDALRQIQNQDVQKATESQAAFDQYTDASSKWEFEGYAKGLATWGNKLLLARKLMDSGFPANSQVLIRTHNSIEGDTVELNVNGQRFTAACKQGMQISFETALLEMESVKRTSDVK